MMAMNLPTMNLPTTMHQPPQTPAPAPPQQPQVASFAMSPGPPGILAASSFGSASSPNSNVNLQLQQAAPLTSSSFHIPSPRPEKRGRNSRLSNGSTHSAPPMMPLPPQQQQDDDDATQSSTKKRRSAQYVAPRTVPTTFTSVTTQATAPAGLRRNLSFSRIDPYVSYAQTPSLMVHHHNNSIGDGMDMDASSGHQSASGDPHNNSRVRSMSF